MKRLFLLLQILLVTIFKVSSQSFDYGIHLLPVLISDLPGIHSFVFGQHEGKWLIMGGRMDGLHPRQPFNAFLPAYSNSNIFVVDVSSLQVWSAPVSGLPATIEEQLLSTNMNFYQDADTLYFIGGYGYSESAGDHITYPYLTAMIVSKTIESIISNSPFDAYFKQITDERFAVTGGQLGKIGQQFHLVGGHRFDGRYNPMDMPTFVQSYTNQVRKFFINNNNNPIIIDQYAEITDAVHLRRRDYNLVPQIFPNGEQGYTISSGVFQIGADLPFLYPVDITAEGYFPRTDFNQYLSHYHSPKIGMYDELSNTMYSLFFGGISQYYYQDSILIKDDLVPFVSTISMLTRDANGGLQEHLVPKEMPGLLGASAEFIQNMTIPSYENHVVKLNELSQDTSLLGHIVGGIQSDEPNPFAFNRTQNTRADNTIFAVYLVKDKPSNIIQINGSNNYHFDAYPNPVANSLTIQYLLEEPLSTRIILSNAEGQIIIMEEKINHDADKIMHSMVIPPDITGPYFFITVVFGNRYFETKKILLMR